ncbi:MAG: hypothetical protein R2785_12065 [Flavobacteriaceae bacterium]
MIERNDIEKLIVEHKKSNLKNHWDDAFFYNTVKYSGEIKPNEILLWRSAYFLRGAYPIFRITFDQNGKLNGIKKEKNPYHKFLNKLFIGIFALIIIFMFITTELRFAILMTGGMALVGFLLNIVLKKSRKYEIKQITDELKETIENIERNKNPELITKPITKPKTEPTKEWTFGKIVTRLIIYPFCGLIVYFSIVGLIPDGKRLLGIFGIIIGIGYPIVDLILAFRTRTTANNGYK